MPDETLKDGSIEEGIMPRKEYTTVSIPVGLIEEIKRLFKDMKDEGMNRGYTGIAEFVREAIRTHINENRMTMREAKSREADQPNNSR